MPKRPTTPPPPDDSQFFTIVNPWPQQPYLTVRDSKAFARWIASIVGQVNLYAFYHKPKSPRMVIIELSKDGFSDLRRLLGEHRWRHVLQTPTEGHADEVSSIFPSTMTTPRSLQKECWQHINVEASWFHKWSPEEDSDIVYPYPLPRFCHPPQEDVMRNPLCRPLREELFHEGTNPVRPARSSAIVLSAYRSLPISDPSDDDLDPEYNSSESDQQLPTPFGASPPGIASTPFAAAIYGADVPKSDCVTVILPHAGSDADTEGEALWAGYGETEALPPADLCEVHGRMCSSGICRQRAMRKREEIRAKRVQARFGEREAWNSARDARQERRGRRDWGARDKGWGSDGGSGSGGEGARGHDGRGKSKNVRGAPGAFSTRAAPDSMPRPAPRALPPHLRKGAATSKVADAASSSPDPKLATSTLKTSVSTSAPSPTSPPSPGSADGDERSADTSSSGSANGVGIQSRPIAAKNGHPRAKVDAREDDAASSSSALTGPPTDGPRNMQRPLQPPPRARPMRWADMVDAASDEEEADEDSEVGGNGDDDLDDLPRGVTVIPGATYGEDGADAESVFSGWDEEAEPF